MKVCHLLNTKLIVQFCHLKVDGQRLPSAEFIIICSEILGLSLRPFKIYCASPPITSQLVIFLWQTLQIGPLGRVRVVEALQKCDPVTLSGIRIHIAGVLYLIIKHHDVMYIIHLHLCIKHFNYTCSAPMSVSWL